MLVDARGTLIVRPLSVFLSTEACLPAGFEQYEGYQDSSSSLSSSVKGKYYYLLCESIPTNMADRDVATKSPENDAPDDIDIIPEDTSAHEGANMGVGYAIKP